MTGKKNRVKLYADPNVRNFLTSKWLLTSQLDGMFKLPNVLAQMGLKGNVTAFKSSEDTISFVHSGSKEHLVLKILPYRQQETVTCKIPNYKEHFSPYFAVLRLDGKRECFFDYSQKTGLIEPRFARTTYSNGVTFIEASKNSPTIRVTFEVDKLFGSKLYLTVVIKNTVNDINVVDNYSETILSILNNGSGKNVYKYYESVAKYLKYTAIDYTVSLNDDAIATDEVVIKSNSCQKFKVTSPDGSSVTLFDNRDWIFESPIVNVKHIGQDFAFEAKLAEFELDKLPPINEIEQKIRSFIGNNMWFAFEKEQKNS